MIKANDYVEMILKSVEFFSNDGVLKADELQQILDIAERDGKIDMDEISVLTNVIKRIQAFELDDAMLAKLAEIQKKI